jgi:hypothetical protein
MKLPAKFSFVSYSLAKDMIVADILRYCRGKHDGLKIFLYSAFELDFPGHVFQEHG